jgi:hypothetical protein
MELIRFSETSALLADSFSFLLGVLFGPENGAYSFLRNVAELLPSYAFHSHSRGTNKVLGTNVV